MLWMALFNWSWKFMSLGFWAGCPGLITGSNLSVVLTVLRPSFLYARMEDMRSSGSACVGFGACGKGDELSCVRGGGLDNLGGDGSWVLVGIEGGCVFVDSIGAGGGGFQPSPDGSGGGGGAEEDGIIGGWGAGGGVNEEVIGGGGGGAFIGLWCFLFGCLFFSGLFCVVAKKPLKTPRESRFRIRE